MRSSGAGFGFATWAYLICVLLLVVSTTWQPSFRSGFQIAQAAKTDIEIEAGKAKPVGEREIEKHIIVGDECASDEGGEARSFGVLRDENTSKEDRGALPQAVEERVRDVGADERYLGFLQSVVQNSELTNKYLNELAGISDSNLHLERTFLSPGSLRALASVRRWMEDAGLRTWLDSVGNLHGRYETKKDKIK